MLKQTLSVAEASAAEKIEVLTKQCHAAERRAEREKSNAAAAATPLVAQLDRLQVGRRPNAPCTNA